MFQLGSIFSCRSTMNPITSLNFDNIKFEAPVRHNLMPENKIYYTQALKYQDDILVIPTNWFYSNGLFVSLEKYDVLTPISADILNILRKIESIAISNGLQLPSEYQHHSNNIKNVFRPTPERNSLYLKLAQNAAFFDRNTKCIGRQDLKMGDYRVAIHIKGLYIGPHGSDNIASLQLRILQIQYVPNIPQCIFTALPIAQPSNIIEIKMPNQTVDESSNSNTGSTTGKKSRKPKLQRQNAMIENQSEQVMETLSDDFFKEVLSNN